MPDNDEQKRADDEAHRKLMENFANPHAFMRLPKKPDNEEAPAQ